MNKLQTFLFRFYSDHTGAIAVITALSLTALVGFAGLGVETAQWYTTKRSIQAAADDAALSAAVAYGLGDTANYVSEGKSVAGTNGFVDGANNVVVTVNKPPLSGSYASNNSAVQVTIVALAKPILSKMFIGDFNISGSSVAIINGPSSNGCVLALNGAAAGAGSVSGTSTNITLNNCSFDVNSKNAAALTMSGGSSLTAAQVILGGNDSIANNATLTAVNGVRTNAPPVTDPYASKLTMPTPARPCINEPSPVNGKLPLYAGTYCGKNDFKFTGGVTVTLNPGVYILDGIDFNMAGGTTINGTGVTIILTSSSDPVNNTGNIIINGGAIVNLTAPTSGAYSGVVFWQDGRAVDSGKDNFNGGSGMNVTGVIYTPSETVSYSGGNATGGSACTQIIASIINFNGNSAFNNNCAGVGTSDITASTAMATLGQ
ncbi:MAG TPA: pilus assembly protein TadG-related protein [Stellaceae bacterium]|jgi:hypothetical protein|nr:pilus assembly protein TadG-related protein [Stellaceae bacterium]